MTTTKKTKLSRRPLRRIIKLQVELGPYSIGFRDGTSPAACRYVLWVSEIPRGKKRRRFMAVVQAVTRPGNLGDEIHNPVLFRKIVQLPPNQDSEYVAKGCYRQACKAMYFLIKDLLHKATRPMVKSCGDDIIAGKTCDGEPACWHSFDPGNAADTLGDYRQMVLQALQGKYLDQWENYDPRLNPFPA
jgi:hypothetical protein